MNSTISRKPKELFHTKQHRGQKIQIFLFYLRSSKHDYLPVFYLYSCYVCMHIRIHYISLSVSSLSLIHRLTFSIAHFTMCGGKCEEMEDRKDMMNALCVHSKDKIIMLFFSSKRETENKNGTQRSVSNLLVQVLTPHQGKSVSMVPGNSFGRLK